MNTSTAIKTQEQAVAILVECKRLLGRQYKLVIRHGWSTGNYGALSSLACELQQIRNSFGPTWLERTVA